MNWFGSRLSHLILFFLAFVVFSLSFSRSSQNLEFKTRIFPRNIQSIYIFKHFINAPFKTNVECIHSMAMWDLCAFFLACRHFPLISSRFYLDFYRSKSIYVNFIPLVLAGGAPHIAQQYLD